MKSKRSTKEQKIRILREAERTDITIVDLCGKKDVNEQAFYPWKKEFRMMSLDPLRKSSLNN